MKFLNFAVIVTIVFAFFGCSGGSQLDLVRDLSGNDSTRDIQATYFVSTDGDDSNTGTFEAPFRTIERAQSEVRHHNQSMTGDIIVNIRGGRYELQDTLNFGLSDSGSNSNKVIYQSYLNERAILSGGKRLTGWQHIGNGIVQKYIGAASFRQIYVNGTRAIRARYPNEGFYLRTRDYDIQNKKIIVSARDVSNWTSLDQVEMVIQASWTDHHANLSSIENGSTGDTKSIIIQEPLRQTLFYYSSLGAPPLTPSNAYHFENAIEFLDSPGEWVYSAGLLKYKLRAGENVSNLSVVIPQLETILKVQGTVSDLSPSRVHDLEFHGLGFEDSNWSEPSSEGWAGLQAGVGRDVSGGVKLPPAGVELISTDGIVFERNSFKNMGAMGLGLKASTRNTFINGNSFLDIAGIAIGVGTQSLLEYTLSNYSDERLCFNDVIKNNYIHKIGRDYSGSVAILAGYVRGILIEHNDISDAPYTGINLGWGWISQPSAMRDNIVQKNYIHSVMQLHDDGGAVYTLSQQPGTLISKNYIQNISRSMWAMLASVAGIYLDRGSSGMTISDNVIFAPARTIEHFYGGPTNSFINNEGTSSQTISEAGLQPEYADLRPVSSDRYGFGGMYGRRVDGLLNFPNPVTGANSCPTQYGYVPTQVSGSPTLSGYFTGDGDLFVCTKKLEEGEESLLDYGGSYGGRYDYTYDPITHALIGHSFFPNPATDANSCPVGYQPSTARNSPGYDYAFTYCYRSHQTGRPSFYEFGGAFGYQFDSTTLSHMGYPNFATQEMNCPLGFQKQYANGTFFGTVSAGQPNNLNLVDYPVTMCFR